MILKRLRNFLVHTLSPTATFDHRQTSSVEVEQLLETGLAFHHAGNLDGAKSSYQQVLEIDPACALALHRLGLVFAQQGRTIEAESCLLRSLAINADDAVLLCNLGGVAKANGHIHEAATYYRQALDIDDRRVEAYYGLGNALQAMDRFDDAIQAYDRVLVLQPDHVDALNNRSVALHSMRRFREAAEACRQVIAMRPDHYLAYTNLGNSCKALSLFPEAIANYRKAVQINPRYLVGLNNLGNMLKDDGQLEAAIAIFDQALAISPGDPATVWHRSLALLMAGNLAEGFPGYESRFTRPGGAVLERQFVQPLWVRQPLTDKTILLHGEQGFGDVIQFARFVPAVVSLGARVVLEVHRELKSLFATMPGVAGIYGRGELLPVFDFHCPLASLPNRLGTVIETIPSSVPYLFPPPQRIRDWSKRLNAADAILRVGLVWRSNPVNANIYSSKSLPLRMLAPLAGYRSTRFYGLQKGTGQEEIATAAIEIDDLADELADFADTAAVLAQLDLVISVDTAVAHLAGALGRPVWLLLSRDSCWRWLRGRDDSPWYPTMRLFRQEFAGDWTGPVTNLAQAFADLRQTEFFAPK